MKKLQITLMAVVIILGMSTSAVLGRMDISRVIRSGYSSLKGEIKICSASPQKRKPKVIAVLKKIDRKQQ